MYGRAHLLRRLLGPAETEGQMEMGLSVSEMSRRLGRQRRTIQRELARTGYRPDSADRRA